MFELKSNSSFTFSILFKPQSGMRFTTFFGVFAVATLVSARAIPLLYKRECRAQRCISALAAAGVTCAAAILEEGLNPVADTECIISAGDVAFDIDACTDCLS
ncbi:hypothetical protein C8J57DRAFT_1362655 [Mycena rebaudengoi]|nr:hypothetical protein C8J57DRAFT_1362655 [Mycena rebaudengoi]